MSRRILITPAAPGDFVGISTETGNQIAIGKTLMTSDNLFSQGACAALRVIEARGLPSSALWNSCRQRITNCDADIGAFVCLAGDIRPGPVIQPSGLEAVPVGIKDIIDTIDFPTSYGSAIYQGFQPPRDAYVVASLKRAGALIAGKTHTCEFAGPAPAPTRNPRKRTASPGGSSAGSAAAVAAGMVPLAIGTQTAGSVIRPAAFCGVIGFKPSFGLIDTTGIRPAAVSLDTVGLFARHVEDIARLASVLIEDPELATLPGEEGTPRLGLWRTHDFFAASSAIQSAFEEAAGVLAGMGFELLNVLPPSEFACASQASRLVLSVETRRSTASEMLSAPGQVSQQMQDAIRSCAQATSADLRNARETLGRASAAFDTLMDERGLDILLTPAAADEAPDGLDWTGDPIFNRVWTGIGVPVITLPQCFGPRQLPIGLQLVGRRGQDRRLLVAATMIETAFRRTYGNIFAVTRGI
jgi:Asp-tRNA(Asn)/Glu-tRNA(Gln) amidotransferase A subunit family amidase